ncbi:outer membrane lipoprotein-sorting protein [candidate division KSB1 bacterium]|nr:outer membrane lipoprotein-sorting protein [candidate division KSB1 bacterium]
MRKFLIILLVLPALLAAQTPTGDEILKRVDDNMTADNKIVTSKMIIHSRRGSRTIEAKSWLQGSEKSFTEYLAPAREKGTKMLKLEDQLWTYSPSTDRIIRIAGHLLRQSVMGSDLSYEDMMEDPELHNLYTASVNGEETVNGRLCWVLDLVGKKEDLAYQARKIWVDKERFLILREERFAKSGKLLKSTDITETMKIDNRWIAKRIVFKDALKTGGGTEFVIESINFNADIPDYVFSKASLRR